MAMGRPKRAGEAGAIYHMLNRANRRATIFHKAAELCDAPEAWRFGSLWRWRHGTSKEKSLLSAWPIPRRSGWVELVRQQLTAKEQERLRRSMKRGAPYGEETWVESIARRFDLESTLRPRGRPKKLPN